LVKLMYWSNVALYDWEEYLLPNAWETKSDVKVKKVPLVG